MPVLILTSPLPIFWQYLIISVCVAFHRKVFKIYFTFCLQRRQSLLFVACFSMLHFKLPSSLCCLFFFVLFSCFFSLLALIISFLQFFSLSSLFPCLSPLPLKWRPPGSFTWVCGGGGHKKCLNPCKYRVNWPAPCGSRSETSWRLEKWCI